MILCLLWYVGLQSILLFLSSSYANCAGVTTHLTFLARVVPQEFEDYYPWLKAGAFFPDSLYSCKPSQRLHDIAEYCHWPPFLLSAVKLWQERYGRDPEKRSCPDSLRYQAFLIGVFSHQIVDSSWHSLVEGYRSHGLLRVLAETEFDGRIEDAHNFLDVMGEFIGLSNVITDISNDVWQYYTNSNWSLPVEQDMMELLNRSGLDHDEIDYTELNLCVMRGLSASISEVYVLMNRRSEIMNLAYGVSPAARDFMQEYWLGGEFDLISMLQRCLPVFQGLFNSDIDDQGLINRIQLCGNLPEEIPAKLRQYQIFKIDAREESLFVTTAIPRSNFGTSLALGRFGEDDNLYVAVSSPLENSEGSVYLLPLEEFSTISGSPTSMLPFTPMRGTTVYRFSFRNLDYLVVSEPGLNRIYFYRCGRKILTLQDGLTQNAFQLHVSSISDIDGDYIPDLLLSGAGYGENETGCVIIIPGAGFVTYLDSNQHTRVDVSKLSTIRLDGGPFSRPYQHFGAAVASSQTFTRKGFLFVSCQGLGAVFVYSLSNLQSSSLPSYVVIGKTLLLPNEDPPLNFEVVSSTVHGMFGKVLHSWSHGGINYIAISQHLFNTVYVYRELEGFLQFFLCLELKVDPKAVSQSIGFGTAIFYDSRFEALFISSPGYFEGRGAIWKVTMQELIEAVETWRLETLFINVPRHLNLINPEDRVNGVSNFGKSLEVAPDGRLIIGIPQFQYGNLRGKQLTGAILIK